MKRGDVVRVDLPRPAGAPGHEQFGERPAVVIQVNDALAPLSTVVVVPLTSNQRALAFAESFHVTPSPTNGLEVPSVALTSQVRAIDVKRVARVMGQLGDDDMRQLEASLRRLLGL